MYPLAPYESQYCAQTHFDTLACEAYSFVHLIYSLTGVYLSPRALAVDACLQNVNNRSVQHILDIVNSKGVVLYKDCPTPQNFTFDSYYAPLTASENEHFSINVSLITADLQKSPLWIQLLWPGMAHMAEGITVDENGNPTSYFDSEVGAPIKPINGILKVGWKSSIKINKFNMPIYSTVVKKDGKTLGVRISSPNGDQIIYATDEAQWRSWNLPTSYSLPTVNVDGTTNWTAQYTLPF